MIEQFNDNTFLIINNLAHKIAWCDGLAILTAKYSPLIFIALLVYLWFSNKKNSRNNALYAGCCVILGLSLNLIIEFFYFHPRPFMNNIGTTLINHVADTSFPSDHTTFMLSISVFLLLLKETRKIGIIFTIIGIIGGLSRVMCGVHYPVDVLGALLVAVVSGFLILGFKKQLVNINQYIMGVYDRILKIRFY
ncbi:MAG: undecaprenyl-diphosphatase [Desulfobacteraceae bacterium]|nr:undecaprenyl-diphosphatase [Desulfobacteraceae bacterium]